MTYEDVQNIALIGTTFGFLFGVGFGIFLKAVWDAGGGNDTPQEPMT